MINCAIIGVHGFGRIHYNDLLRETRNGRCRIRAAAIRPHHWESPEVETLRAMGTEIFADYREMLETCRGDLDLCCIPTAISQHLPMTKAALNAGANVFVEKPVTPTYQEALEMKAAEKASGKFVAVGYQDIFQAHTHEIKKLILSGCLGKVLSLKCLALWPRPISYYHRNSWAGRIRGEGGELVLDAPFTNATAHFLNLLNFHAGNAWEKTAEIRELKAVMTRCNPIDSCDTAGVEATTADGKRLLFLCSHATDRQVDPVSVIQCERGRISYTMQMATVTDESGDVVAEFNAPDYTGTRQAVMDAVLKRVTDPGQFVCTIDLAAQATLLGNAIFDAAPIVTVPDAAVQVLRVKDETQCTVTGLSEIMETCFVEERLPNTSDYDFLPVPESLDYSAYQGFEGRFCN